ncbi:YbaB/EbfC family nucleoid-associated protein [Actinoplanes sichuanensis]|uniref:YbaB/EbfC DNA-binding family protein n=1 Tax=Actinoplanes sichuanensis TaxID=512349 RepID=A0ABW4ASS6_9ACTN|nr:YbaB/EbfC family nucleoid-associated protein [Actinoplanes sichuanensis]
MTRRLEGLQRRAEELERLASVAHTAAPKSAEGVDASGCVRIVIGPDRLPLQIHIRDRWQDRLDAGSLADAVLEANTDAVRSAYRIWCDRLDGSGWWRQRDAHEAPERRPMPMNSPAQQPRTQRAPDEDLELGERILRLLQDTRRNTSQPSTADGDGSNDSGRVSVRLSPGGLAGCVIDEGWARHRRGDAIAAALSHAVRQARRHLTSPQPGLREADALIGDALAALATLTDRASDRGGER